MCQIRWRSWSILLRSSNEFYTAFMKVVSTYQVTLLELSGNTHEYNIQADLWEGETLNGLDNLL